MVQIDGSDITRLSEAGRDRFRADKIGYVFQTFNLLPRLFGAGKRAAGHVVRRRHGPTPRGHGSCWSASA